MGRTLVIGLGNPVLSDDSVGFHVIEEVRQRLERHPTVEVEAFCRGGLALMERLVGYDRAIIVDAIRTGGPPGTLHRLGLESIPTHNSASGHDVNLPTALAVGRQVGAHLPEDSNIQIIAIEAADCETFSEQCTPEVHQAILPAVEAVLAALQPERTIP